MFTESRQVRLFLIGLTLLGFGLRAYQLGARSAWIDEAETARYAHIAWSAPIKRAFFEGPPISTPPLYFELEHVMATVGLGGAHHRILSLAAGTAAIPLVFALGQSLASPAAGLAAAALLVVSPVHIRYSREARPYALLVLAELMLLLGALRVAARGTRKEVLLFLGGGVLCALLQHAGAVLTAIVALWTFAHRRTLAVFGACMVLAACTMTIALQLWIQQQEHVRLMPHMQIKHVGRRTWEWVAPMMITLGVDRLDWPRVGLAATCAAAALGLFVLVLRRPICALLLAAVVIGPVLAMVMPKSGYQFYTRYAIHIVPILCILAGVTVGGLFDTAHVRALARTTGIAILLAWNVLAVPALWRQLQEGGTPYEQLGALVRELGDPTRDRVYLLGLEEPPSYYGPMHEEALRPYLGPHMSFTFVPSWPGSRRPTDIDDAWLIGWDTLRPQPALEGPLLALHVPDGPDEVTLIYLGRGGAHSGLMLRAPARLRGEADTARLFERARTLYPWVSRRESSDELP